MKKRRKKRKDLFRFLLIASLASLATLAFKTISIAKAKPINGVNNNEHPQK